MTFPKKLYKYCPLGVYSLRAICENEVHHTSPRQFNDPLDCNPTIQTDVSDNQLIELALKMMKDVWKPEAIENWHEERRGFRSSISDLDDDDIDHIMREELLADVLRLLTLDYGLNGVLSLSEHWSEPLLWSHYADQHRGICIEYDTTNTSATRLEKVNYRAPRALRANDLYQWKINGDLEAEKRIFDGYFYAKAEDWQYEHEWRDISDRAGVNKLPFKITAIYVGMRIDPVWVRLLKASLKDRRIDLHQIIVNEADFSLASEPLPNKENAVAEALGAPNRLQGSIFQSIPLTTAQTPTLPESITSINQLLTPSIIGQALSSINGNLNPLNDLMASLDTTSAATINAELITQAKERSRSSLTSLGVRAGAFKTKAPSKPKPKPKSP